MYIPRNIARELNDVTTNTYNFLGQLSMAHNITNEIINERTGKRFYFPEIHGFILKTLLSFVRAFDHNLPEDDEENYYFEREWRIIGNMKFNRCDVRRVLLPSSFAERFRDDFRDYCSQVTFTK